MEKTMTLRGRTAAVLVATLLAGVTACDRSPVEPPGHRELGRVEIYNRATTPNTLLATWTHRDDGMNGWDRNVLMTLSHGAEATRTRAVLGVRMFTRGGNEITLSETGQYSVRYGVASDPDNIINMDAALDQFHGDHVYVYGFHQEARTGTAPLVFALWHGDHDDGETDAIGFTIAE
jgi:hypothetical protein